jgi:multiple sugar transport system substrate-binding protein
MKKKSSTLLLLFAVVFVLGMTACTGSVTPGSQADSGDVSDSTGATASSGAEEKTEISFYEHSDGEAIAYKMAERYMELYPNKKVNVSIIANDDYDDKIKVMLSGGADIDCFWIRGGPQARQLASAGALYPLNDLIAANNVDTSVYSTIIDAFVTGGKTYGLCTSKSCWLLWYNKEMFDAKGLDYPVNLTWEEYSELAASLTTEDIWGSVCPDWTMNLGASAAGEYLTDENLTRTMDYAKYENAVLTAATL